MAAKPYEHQPGETDKAFDAFCLYRDLGISRTLDAVAEQLEKSVTLIGRWSSQYNWRERVSAYDDYIDAQARKKVERDTIKRRAEMLQRHALTGKVMQQKGIAYLDKNGVDKSSDAIAAIAKGIEIERKTEGLPDWMFEMVNVDDDELQRRYAGLLAEIGSNRAGNDAAGDDNPGTDDSTPPAETDD